MARCNCQFKEKKHGILRCRKHEPEYFEDETDAVKEAARNPKPPEPPPNWVDRMIRS